MAETYRIEICPDAQVAARRKTLLEGEGLDFQIEIAEGSNMTILGEADGSGDNVEESILKGGAHWVLVAKK